MKFLQQKTLIKKKHVKFVFHNQKAIFAYENKKQQVNIVLISIYIHSRFFFSLFCLQFFFSLNKNLCKFITLFGKHIVYTLSKQNT